MLDGQERELRRIARSEETLYGSDISHRYSVETSPTTSTFKSNISSHGFDKPSNPSDIALANYPKVCILHLLLLHKLTEYRKTPNVTVLQQKPNPVMCWHQKPI